MGEKSTGCYIVSVTQGICVRRAKSLRSAEASALREHGTANFRSCRPATMSDLSYVKQMGGWLPIEVRPDVEAYEAAQRREVG